MAQGTSVLVRNNVKIDLPLPGGQVVKAGRVVRVDNWQFKESNDIVRGLLREMALEVVTDVKDTRAVAQAKEDARSDTGPADTFLERSQVEKVPGVDEDAGTADKTAHNRSQQRRTGGK